MKANCLFCHQLDPTRGWGEDGCGKCRVKNFVIRKHHRNCATFAPWGPYYEGMVKWIRTKALRLNRVANMIEQEAPEYYASLDTHEKRST